LKTGRNRFFFHKNETASSPLNPMVFSYFPLVYRISGVKSDKRVAVMHGGCFENFEDYTLDDVKSFDRKRGYPEDAIEVRDWIKIWNF